MDKKKKKTVKVSRKKGKVKVIKGKNVLWKKASFNSSKKKVSQPGKVISSFGGIRFFVTKNTALILDNLKQEVSGRWSEHEIIGKNQNQSLQERIYAPFLLKLWLISTWVISRTAF